MIKNILITGGSGFIGSHLKLALNNSKSLNPIDFSRSNNVDLLENNIQVNVEVDSIVHLAGISYVPDSFNNPHKMYRENFISTLNILEFCRKQGIEKFIFMSSYVYGKPKYLPIDEKHPTNIMNPYGRSKLICENLCKSYCEDYGIKLIVLRLFNIFGLNQDKRFLVPSVIDQVLGTNDQIKLDDLDPKRDYLYIKDLISVLETMIYQENKEIFSLYNIGSGVSYSVREIAENILRIFGVNKKIIDSGVRRKNEIVDCIANIKNIETDYNWKPRYSLEEGLLDLKAELDKNV